MLADGKLPVVLVPSLKLALEDFEGSIGFDWADGVGIRVVVVGLVQSIPLDGAHQGFEPELTLRPSLRVIRDDLTGGQHHKVAASVDLAEDDRIEAHGRS